MPRFDDEQALIQKLRDDAGKMKLWTEYTDSGLENTRYEIIMGLVILTPYYHRQSALLLSNFISIAQNIHHHKKLEFLHNFDVKIDNDNIYTPKAIIFDKSNIKNDEIAISNPMIVFEILTNQNKHLLNAKFEHYQTIPTLQEYVLVDGHQPQVWVYRQANHWQAEHYAHHQSFMLQSIDFAVNVADIYRDVNFDKKIHG